MSTSTTNPSREASRSIWVFTPSRTAATDLEAIFVQRHELLKDAVERVRESGLTDHKHHLLFVGPRGCGKTHLVTLIVSRIRADMEASQQLRLAWLNEDETCTSLLELLLKVHSALEKCYPAEFQAGNIAAAYELSPTAAVDFVARSLLNTLGPKTLVIVAENLDALFASMGQEGQKQLRAFIQEHPQCAIVATAQRLVEDLSDRTSPFFGFFQTEHLKPLTVDQAAELLQNIARIQGKTQVTEFLATCRGRSRVRALHHLSGGNHRIYIILAQFMTRESMDALIGPFLKMVDELTPYYQERVRWLSPLQRRIVEMLCACETTVPVKEIARQLFSPPQSISSHLQELRERGYVVSSQRGRESLYEISEPLMRICVEVKENQNTRPLRLLVDFLRVWYDDAELQQRLDRCLPESESFGYFSAALARNDEEGNLRMRLLFQNLFGSEAAAICAEDLRLAETTFLEDFFVAITCIRDGDTTNAMKMIAAALDSATTAVHKSSTLVIRGLLNSDLGNSAAAIADYTRVIELPGAPPLPVTLALYDRGVEHGKLGNSDAAIADYTRVIELPGAPPGQVAMALVNRGALRGKQGNSAAEIADCSRVIELPDASPDHVAMALFNRGVTHFRADARDACRRDLEALIRRDDASDELIVAAHSVLALLHCRDGRWNEGIAEIEASLRLGTTSTHASVNAPVELIGVLFGAGLSPEGRRTYVGSLYEVYARHSAHAVLGEALVKHLGTVFAKGEPWPPSDNLDQWRAAWEQVAGGTPDFRLPLRLLRTEIEFLKSGGKDHGILLNLTSPERTLLRQALGLEALEH